MRARRVEWRFGETGLVKASGGLEASDVTLSASASGYDQLGISTEQEWLELMAALEEAGEALGWRRSIEPAQEGNPAVIGVKVLRDVDGRAALTEEVLLAVPAEFGDQEVLVPMMDGGRGPRGEVLSRTSVVVRFLPPSS